MSLNEYQQERLNKSKAISALGVDPYGNLEPDLTEVGQIWATPITDPPAVVKTQGRIVLRRPSGGICFMTIRDFSGDVQVAMRKNEVTPEVWQLQQNLDLGDIIVVEGALFPSKSGELTVWATKLRLGAKAIDPPPAKHEGLVNAELKARWRYVDLWSDPAVMRTALTRSLIVREIRQYLDEYEYVEVETPMMQSVAGGAAAKPFVTHHNALDIDLYMRIAPELYLKRLLVGGMPRVFEIGRNFRNEGISPRHNPEFTVLEAYEAYGNYESMMKLAEEMVSQVVMIAVPNAGAINFAAPWRRVMLVDLVKEHGGPTTTDKIVQFYENEIEPKLIQPTFVTHFPSINVPLCRASREFPYLAENFELVIGGQEVGTGYTEENDPFIQEERLRSQVGDDVHKLDVDFIRALRVGMPPAGGIGIGIDRLVALICNASSVKDVILFPTLKPEE